MNKEKTTEVIKSEVIKRLQIRITDTIYVPSSSSKTIYEIPNNRILIVKQFNITAPVLPNSFYLRQPGGITTLQYWNTYRLLDGNTIIFPPEGTTATALTAGKGVLEQNGPWVSEIAVEQGLIFKEDVSIQFINFPSITDVTIMPIPCRILIVGELLITQTIIDKKQENFERIKLDN